MGGTMTRKDVTKLFARFLVVFAVCSPIFVLIDSLLDGKIDAVIEVIVFVVIGGVVLFLEEFLHVKALKKRIEQKKVTDVDAFFDEQMQKKLAKKRPKAKTQSADSQDVKSQTDNQSAKNQTDNQNVEIVTKKINISKENKNGK